MKSFSDEMLEAARQFARTPVNYTFTELEKMVLSPFFSNPDKKIFFIQFLPSAMVATLLSMYSRVKNPRGIRGHFVDGFLPLILTSFMEEFKFFLDDPVKAVKAAQLFLKEKKITFLDAFYAHSEETGSLIEEFLQKTAVDKEYLSKIASSGKVKQFLGVFLDEYGHNSIARTGQFAIGMEQVSLLAAKSLEWTRPGSGYIELSSRYVPMKTWGLYPVGEELRFLEPLLAEDTEAVMDWQFNEYLSRIEDKGPDSFREFLARQYSNLMTEEELKKGIFGELFDVLGNLLPAATLTSLGISVSGEALPEIVKHLYLDGTPENFALAELLIEEAEKTGASQFLRHLEISDWQRAGWDYLNHRPFQFEIWRNGSGLVSFQTPSKEEVSASLSKAFSAIERYQACRDFDEVVEKILTFERSDYDKLFSQFEFVSAWGSGLMSFRGWRDVQRQSFSTHLRTYLTPLIGFYRYDKPAPEEFFQLCDKVHQTNFRLYSRLERTGVPQTMRQYPMAIGNLIGFHIGSNLRQWEFCNWQRSKYSVNHEVRQVFLSAEDQLRKVYPWWAKLSRADVTPAYVFARTSEGIPLSPPVAA